MKPRLLIVDDEELVSRSLARAFRRSVDVATAANTAAARTLLATYPFDVVLIDLKMRSENGLHLLGELATQFPLVRRVLMTDEPIDLQPHLDNGTVHAALTKPFDLDRAAEVLGLTSMRLASINELKGAFVTSLADLPLVQVVLQLAPSEAELKALISWQQQLLETGVKHALLFVIEPSAGLSLSRAALVAKWFAPTRAQGTAMRTGLAVVSSPRLERMAISAANNVMAQAWPVRTFTPDELHSAAQWLRSTLQAAEPLASLAR